jgi:sterol desaturase/sphingolipid hydroxylase (fatty acid hydroxylase superfamily)
MTHVHPVTPLVLWVPVLIFIARHISTLQMDIAILLGLGFSGLITWTITEYVMHRYFFHYCPTSEWGRKFIYIVHGIHHDDPHDASRLVMPPVPGALTAAAFFALFYSVLGAQQVFPFFFGFMTGYLCYDYIHYGIHHFKPRGALGKFMRKYHYTHHFAEHEAKWGVSTPLWDYVFGTLQPRVQKNPSAYESEYHR